MFLIIELLLGRVTHTSFINTFFIRYFKTWETFVKPRLKILTEKVILHVIIVDLYQFIAHCLIS